MSGTTSSTATASGPDGINGASTKSPVPSGSATAPGNRPWLKTYGEMVPADIAIEGETFTGLILEAFKKFPERTAVSCLGADWTFKRLADDSEAFAGFLRHRGVKPGDRVAIMMPTMPQYVSCMMGLMRAGCILVGTNPTYTSRELEHQLNDSGAKAVVILDQFAHMMDEVQKKTEVETVVVAKAGDIFGGLKGTIANLVLKHVKKKVPDYDVPGHVTLGDALKEGKGKKIDDVLRAPDDVAALQYTGGTTGVAKGAMLTEKNLRAATEIGHLWMKPFRKTGDEIDIPVGLVPLPLYHVFTLYIVATSLGEGARLVFVPDPRDSKALVSAMKDTAFDMMIGVDRLYAGLAHSGVLKDIDMSACRVCISGGAPTMKSTAESWHRQTGIWITEGWGMTETVAAGTCNPKGVSSFTGSVGVPMPSTDIEMRDDNGEVVAQGERGEIWIAGPQVMKGYWQRPEATAEAIDDRGYLATGDIGVMDENGFIEIVDRKKDMVLVSGFNVYPSEIEDVVDDIDGVLEAAVIGVKDDTTGEAVRLFVVKSDPALTEEKVRAACKANLTNYKRPRDIIFIDELPKSAVGKILRRELTGHNA